MRISNPIFLNAFPNLMPTLRTCIYLYKRRILNWFVIRANFNRLKIGVLGVKRKGAVEKLHPFLQNILIKPAVYLGSRIS